MFGDVSFDFSPSNVALILGTSNRRQMIDVEAKILGYIFKKYFKD